MSITLSFPLLAQAFVSGIMLGGVFALIAIGLTLIWGVMGIINFAHGEFLMVGMYIAYFLAARTGLDPYFTILVTVPALFLIG
ncbi:MAG: branched-chain amino acid ABC transporter permease, partial [Chloroflexota bacterium]